MRPVAVAVSVLVLLGSCNRNVVVTQRVILDIDDAGPRGFTCTDSRGKPLAYRAANGMFSVVTDLISIGGNPDCRGVELRDWCATHTCQVLQGQRQCFPVAIDAAAAKMGDGAVTAEVLAVLQGQVISPNAPNEYILVRAVATVQPCSDLTAGPSFDCGSLMGCATSCPYYPLGPAGNIPLDLDYSSPSQCEDAMFACASPTGSAVTTCEADAGPEE